MRNSWPRFVLLLRGVRSQACIYQVRNLPCVSSSIGHSRASYVNRETFHMLRLFSSSPEPVVEPPKDSFDQWTRLDGIFGEAGRPDDEIQKDLDSKNVMVTYDLILSYLRRPETDPVVAATFFDWVLRKQSEKLSSKSYNYMLGILGTSGLRKEVWAMIESMKQRGYGVKKGAFVRISERFLKDGLNDDVEKLKGLYASGSASCEKNVGGEEKAFKKVCSRMRELIRKEVWGDEVEKQLMGLDVKFTSDLVVTVLDSLDLDPNKALIFFRWLQESGAFSHDQKSFNAMARVLSKEDHSQKFWMFVNEMRSKGHEMERETYIHILERFVKRKMIKDAVDLYEFAMTGGNKPSVQDVTFLLKKIIVSKELDMALLRKVVRCYKVNGNALTDANLDAVIKSLTSVGRVQECIRILMAMGEAGYVPSVSARNKLAYKLSSGGKTEEAMDFMDKYVGSNDPSDRTTWESLVRGHCVARNLDAASKSFEEMLEKEGASHVGHALDLLVCTYCRKNKPFDAYKFVLRMVHEKGVTPWHSTYKALTSNLLRKRLFKQALDVMSLMKAHGYPPDLDSFLKYLSRDGTSEDASEFTQAMTSKTYPSTSVFLRLIDAYFAAKRPSTAQDFLSKCPRYIKNHPDILDLFSSRQSKMNRIKRVTV